MKCKIIFKHGGLPDSMFDSKQLKMGIKAESEEHTNNKCLAKQIAKSHLLENPQYYTFLHKMEKSFKK